MVALLAATTSEIATAFIEIGLVAVVLSALARAAGRLGMTAVPLYLLAGLGLGEGGIIDLDVSEEFIALGAEIGVLLLLFSLGLEYSHAELRQGLRTGAVAGIADAVLNFTPGLVAGLVLGWTVPVAVLLGGVTWISSSGVISKLLDDLGRLGNRETPAILNLLVIEDLAMAVYLPIVAAVVAGDDAAQTAITVGIAIGAVALVFWTGGAVGERLSAQLATGSDEALLLAVFGLTLAVGGVAQQLHISAAVGAFLVGLSLTGAVQERADTLVSPLRDLFAAIFFLFFSFQISPADLPAAIVPALVLAVVTAATKLVVGWLAASRLGSGARGRVRVGTALIARGEFSIVIAALGAGVSDGASLGALAAAYVLITAIAGPLAAKYSDSLVPRRLLAA